MPRKTYSAEFKAEAVELVRSSPSSARAVAHDLGLSPTMLNRWCREAQGSSKPAFQGSGTPRDQELARLKRELAQVKKERDFLRDAATYFAKESS
ncbi:transposase [Salinisphaera orenii]|uniref:Transposase n=1 Tax=Salinisphaera orenii YIM 95161 TaxID=1051139 RepID=A0A423PDA1_9GAMM|nr:transposase [Salinisphaera halophila YIM 95161]